MKKAFIIPMIALATLGMVSCGQGQSSASSSQAPATSSKAPFVVASLSIKNKDELKALWRVGFDNRALTLEVKDAAGNDGNPAALVMEGGIKITSTNEAVVKAMGLSLIPMGPGTATITVVAGQQTDNVEIEVKDKRTEAGVEAILEEFKDLGKGKYTEESVPCVGVVSRYETFYNAKDKNVTVWIKDAEGTHEIELYKVPGAKGVDLSDLIPGDTVHVEGKIQNYNGTFEYTAAGSITKVDKIARPTPAVRPQPTETTIDAIIEKQQKEQGVEYKVEGIWENPKNDDYGNGYLTNPETGKSIQVYGSTATESAIEFNGLTGSPLYIFTNPKDAKTTLKDLKAGMKVTANALNITYVSGTKVTPEIAMVVKAQEAVETKYAASVEPVENGTVQLSKTEELAYGEEVTVTVEVAEGYKLSKLEVDHGYGKQDITEAKKFNATVANKVIATIEPDMPEGWVEAVLNVTSWVGKQEEFASATKVTEIQIDEVAKATVSGTDANSGKVYGPGNTTGLWEWRVYKSGSAKVTITVAEGYKLEKAWADVATANWGAANTTALTVAENAAVVDSVELNSNFNLKGIKVQYSVVAPNAE